MRIETPSIPDRWKSVPAKALFKRVRRLPREGHGVVTAFRDGEVTLRSNRRTEGFTDAIHEHGYQGVCKGDLVIHSMDGFAGAIGVSDSDGKASPVVHCYRVEGNNDVRFYAYLLRHLASSDFITALAKGIRERSTSFDAETFGDLVLPRPGESEQYAIADFLDTETARIDALITKKRRMIELLDEQYESRCASTLLAGLDPVHGTLEGCLVGGWEVAALGVLVMLHRGFDLPLDEREPGAVPVVSSGGISGSHSTAMCSPPGVVTGRYGTIGEVFFVDKPYWPLNTTLFVSDFRGNDERWVFHLLKVLPLDYDAAKSAVTGINRNVIGGLRVPRPSVNGQRRMADLLDRAQRGRDRAVGVLERQVGLLQERRQALITAAVTGELELPGVAA